jgi:HAD superfamily hydrolase (TIGR01509 family)
VEEETLQDFPITGNHDIILSGGPALKNIHAIIFDMDGLLLDSERIALSTFIDACREHDFEPDVNVYFKCIGTTEVQTREILLNGYGKDFPFNAVYKLWKNKYHEEISSKPVPLKDGVLDLLQYLQKKDIKKAVVTSTNQESAVKRLASSEIVHFFEFVLGGDQVSRGKPDPEIYLTACRKLNVAPANCLALEDSNNGVLSAFSAGLTVIQIPDLLEPSARVKALGHNIVKSLFDVENILKQFESIM